MTGLVTLAQKLERSPWQTPAVEETRRVVKNKNELKLPKDHFLKMDKVITPIKILSEHLSEILFNPFINHGMNKI